MEMPGGFLKAFGKGVRDRLFAVACVVSDGKMPVALVGTDTLAISRASVEARADARLLRIPKSRARTS